MRILVAVHDAEVLSVVSRLLEEKMYEFDMACDAEEGLKMALERSYGLIVLDWMLPGDGGMTLMKKLRKNKARPQVLMLTDKDSPPDIGDTPDSGPDDYLVKPFTNSDFIDKILAVLPRTDRVAEITFHDLRMDPVMRKAWRKDRELKLTAKECLLLEYLMLRPNQVLSRQMLWRRGSPGKPGFRLPSSRKRSGYGCLKWQRR